MAPKTHLLIWTLALMHMLALAHSKVNTNAVSCSSVSLQLSPCIEFITGKTDRPSSQCCTGATRVASDAKTKDDREAVCECIKKSAVSIPKLDYSRIPQITKSCSIQVSLPPITKDIDCKSIPFGGFGRLK